MMANDAAASHRILVIDDNPSIHEDYRKILAKPIDSQNDLEDMESVLFGSEAQSSVPNRFEIDVAFQGREGMEMVEQAQSEGRPYAVAFVDGRMPPGWDGVETIHHLWTKSPDLQVVLCTAYADYSWQEIRNMLGESDSLLILKKPFDNSEVLQMAHALTRKWEQNREIQGRLNKLAFYDNLTGLPNRALFLDRLTQTIEQAGRYENKSALMFIDMDNFKRINDTLGHGIGDDLLRLTAKRLNKCLRASDTVARPKQTGVAARLGGDEFTVILPMLDTREGATVVAKRITEYLSQPMDLAGHQVIITPSIGIAMYPDDGDTADELLKNADLAMYFAKRIGPNAYKFYHPSMNASGLKRLTIENHLRKAIDQEEFSLHYQPQFDLATGRLSGLEALLRWDNWELGSVPPLEFIHIAEECGLIISIGEWVLRTACSQAAAWIEEELPLQRMAINLSVKQLDQPNFIQTVKKILDETGLSPNCLEFEVTENILENDSTTFRSTLDALRNMGIGIAVDDFGYGYSNMSRLNNISFDCIKIDRSFINNIDGGTLNQSIVSAILTMAKAMNVRVVAEGVETTAQVDFLCDKQCQEAQGYLFGRPFTKTDTEAFLRRSFYISDREENNKPAKA